MRILIDARLYGLENAGLGRYLINLINGLSKIDSENEYIVLLRKKYFNALLLPENWKKILVDIRHYSFAEQIKIPLIIRKEKPDITHFPHFNVPLFFKGKYIVTIHDMLMHKSVGLAATTLPIPLYLIKRVAYRLVFDNAVKHSTKIITPSKTIKDEILAEYRVNTDKIVVTYEGFDKKIAGSSEISVQKPYFVYVGNAYPHKNLANLVKAMKLLNTESDHNVFLLIASSRNIFTQRIQSLIQNMGVNEFVKILGFVPDNDLGGLYKNSIGFVFPSFSEGFGLPGLEALASGTLLLASNIKVFKEIYEINALYFDQNDPSSIANTMLMAMSISSGDRKNKIESSLEFVKRYSWDKMARETLEIYAKSCNRIRPG